MEDVSGSSSRRSNVQVVVRIRPMPSEAETVRIDPSRLRRRSTLRPRVPLTVSTSGSGAGAGAGAGSRGGAGGSGSIHESCITVDSDTQVTVQRPFDPKQHSFSFDHCFPPTSSQADVFSVVGQAAVDDVVDGYNMSIFAYGMTSAGKSFTMLGEGRDVGIVPRLTKRLFRKLDAVASPTSMNCVEAAYLEIYNEQVRDLLAFDDASAGGRRGGGGGGGGGGGARGAAAPRPPLKVREHPKTGPFVEGLSWHAVESHRDNVRLLDLGSCSRAVSATHMNVQSSRSHAVYLLRVRQTLLEGSNATDTTSTVSLVDLAGSERASSATDDDRFTESKSINKSLSTLGLVIQTLVEAGKSGSGSTAHVPYRNSTLTWLLQDSLGGNAKTVFVACVHPSSTFVSETLSTLRYAARASKITNQARVNTHKTLIQKLRDEIASLREQLAAKPVVRVEVIKDNPELLAEVESLRELQEEWQARLQATADHLNAGDRSCVWIGARTPVADSSSDDDDADAECVDTCPFLVSIQQDPQLSHRLRYDLRVGRMLLGSDGTADIQISGASILPFHATLTSQFDERPGAAGAGAGGSGGAAAGDDSDDWGVGSFGWFCRIVASPGADVRVNGVLVSEEVPVDLQQGDRVVLGGLHFFQFWNPSDVPPDMGPKSPGDYTHSFVNQELLVSHPMLAASVGIGMDRHVVRGMGLADDALSTDSSSSSARSDDDDSDSDSSSFNGSSDDGDNDGGGGAAAGGGGGHGVDGLAGFGPTDLSTSSPLPTISVSLDKTPQVGTVVAGDVGIDSDAEDPLPEPSTCPEPEPAPAIPTPTDNSAAAGLQSSPMIQGTARSNPLLRRTLQRAVAPPTLPSPTTLPFPTTAESDDADSKEQLEAVADVSEELSRLRAQVEAERQAAQAARDMLAEAEETAASAQAEAAEATEAATAATAAAAAAAATAAAAVAAASPPPPPPAAAAAAAPLPPPPPPPSSSSSSSPLPAPRSSSPSRAEAARRAQEELALAHWRSASTLSRLSDQIRHLLPLIDEGNACGAALGKPVRMFPAVVRSVGLTHRSMAGTEDEGQEVMVHHRDPTSREVGVMVRNKLTGSRHYWRHDDALDRIALMRVMYESVLASSLKTVASDPWYTRPTHQFFGLGSVSCGGDGAERKAVVVSDRGRKVMTLVLKLDGGCVLKPLRVTSRLPRATDSVLLVWNPSPVSSGRGAPELASMTCSRRATPSTDGDGAGDTTAVFDEVAGGGDGGGDAAADVASSSTPDFRLHFAVYVCPQDDIRTFNELASQARPEPRRLRAPTGFFHGRAPSVGSDFDPLTPDAKRFHLMSSTKVLLQAPVTPTPVEPLTPAGGAGSGSGGSLTRGLASIYDHLDVEVSVDFLTAIPGGTDKDLKLAFLKGRRDGPGPVALVNPSTARRLVFTITQVDSRDFALESVDRVEVGAVQSSLDDVVTVNPASATPWSGSSRALDVGVVLDVVDTERLPRSRTLRVVAEWRDAHPKLVVPSKKGERLKIPWILKLYVRGIKPRCELRRSMTVKVVKVSRMFDAKRVMLHGDGSKRTTERAWLLGCRHRLVFVGTDVEADPRVDRLLEGARADAERAVEEERRLRSMSLTGYGDASPSGRFTSPSAASVASVGTPGPSPRSGGGSGGGSDTAAPMIIVQEPRTVDKEGYVHHKKSRLMKTKLVRRWLTVHRPFASVFKTREAARDPDCKPLALLHLLEWRARPVDGEPLQFVVSPRRIGAEAASWTFEAGSESDRRNWLRWLRPC